MKRPLAVTVLASALIATRAVAADSGEASAEQKPRETSFAVVPGPFYNPSIGLGLNVMPLMMFYPDKDDTVSPPSLVLINALYAVKPPLSEASSRQSGFVSAATRLFLDEDRWRVVVMAAYINLFQQFYGVGGDASYSDPLFDYRLEQVLAFTQVYRQVGWKGFYLGVMLGYIAFHTKTDDPANQEILESIGSGADWRGQPIIGALAQFDSRNNKYYPSTGTYFNLRVNGSFKSGEDYLVVAPGFNQYYALQDTDRLVFAYRIYGQFGWGNLPIGAYARYGMRGSTLGYEVGEFLDKMMSGAEAEIRWMAWKRVGLEGGAGVGKVFADFSDFSGQPWLPGVWGSATYKVMEKQDIRARMSLAYGKSGLLYYFAVGQNF
jgi:hypothetical protein